MPRLLCMVSAVIVLWSLRTQADVTLAIQSGGAELS